MKIFNIEIRKVLPDKEQIKRDFLEATEQNATRGLIQAELELAHHSLLLEDAEATGRTEAEIKGYTEAIERDHKSINNWKNQLKAINHERNT